MTFQPPPPPPPPPSQPSGQPGAGQPQWAPPPQQPMGAQQPMGQGPGQPMNQPTPPAQHSGWNPSPYGSGRPAFDPKTVNPLDWGILACGVLAFIFSFVSYYTVSIFSFSAWHGFFGWFAVLCALVGSAAIALEIFQPELKLPAANKLIALGAYAVATLCVILALFIYPGSGYPSDVVGHGFGYWINLILIIAGLALCYMRFSQSGGKLPFGSNRPAGGSYGRPS